MKPRHGISDPDPIRQAFFRPLIEVRWSRRNLIQDARSLRDEGLRARASGNGDIAAELLIVTWALVHEARRFNHLAIRLRRMREDRLQQAREGTNHAEA